VDVSDQLAGWAERWISDPAARASAARAITTLRDRVAVPGASARAAERIVAFAGSRAHPLVGPHRTRDAGSMRAGSGDEAATG
jgi:hypothetical protein